MWNHVKKHLTYQHHDKANISQKSLSDKELRNAEGVFSTVAKTVFPAAVYTAVHQGYPIHAAIDITGEQAAGIDIRTTTHRVDTVPS
jgi:hypothetical protein